MREFQDILIFPVVVVVGGMGYRKSAPFESNIALCTIHWTFLHDRCKISKEKIKPLRLRRSMQKRFGGLTSYDTLVQPRMKRACAARASLGRRTSRSMPRYYILLTTPTQRLAPWRRNVRPNV